MSGAPNRVHRHFTASAFVTAHQRVLLLLHATKALWLPPGGHVELDENPAAAAVREVREETGLAVRITSPLAPAGCQQSAPRPEAMLEVEVGPGHIHIDLVFFATPLPGVDPEDLQANEEAVALRWWSASDLRAASDDDALPADVLIMAMQALAQAER